MAPLWPLAGKTSLCVASKAVCHPTVPVHIRILFLCSSYSCVDAAKDHYYLTVYSHRVCALSATPYVSSPRPSDIILFVHAEPVHAPIGSITGLRRLMLMNNHI